MGASRDGPVRAAALVIGNELLSGKIADENVVVLARTLRGIGVELHRVLVIGDDREEIAREIQALSDGYDVVFTSGGVGPTHDDVTLDAVGDAFGVAVEPVEHLAERLREHYGARLTEGHLRMARAPAGARLIDDGDVPWPTVVMHNVWVLPGVPPIFAMKMSRVRRELGGSGAFVCREVYSRMDEGTLKPYLDEVVASHAGVAVGSYPKWNDDRYRTLVTFDGRDEVAVRGAAEAFVAAVPAESIVDLDDERG